MSATLLRRPLDCSPLLCTDTVASVDGKPRLEIDTIQVGLASSFVPSRSSNLVKRVLEQAFASSVCEVSFLPQVQLINRVLVAVWGTDRHSDGSRFAVSKFPHVSMHRVPGNAPVRELSPSP